MMASSFSNYGQWMVGSFDDAELHSRFQRNFDCATCDCDFAITHGRLAHTDAMALEDPIVISPVQRSETWREGPDPGVAVDLQV